MGPEQAASVLTQVKIEAAKAKGKAAPEKELDDYRKEIENTYNQQASAYYSTARLWDDGIIDPVNTRDVLALSISASLNSSWNKADYGVFRT